MPAMIIKDIRLKPAIGRWFEYRPHRGYTTVAMAEGLSAQALDEILFLHHAYATSLGEIFKTKLALAIDLHDVTLSQTPYSDFIAERTGHALTVAWETSYGGGVTMACDVSLATALINRVTGGKGLGQKKAVALTDIETIALTTVFQGFLKEYQQQWLQSSPKETTALVVHSPKIKLDERIRKDTQVLVFSILIACGDQEPAVLEFMLPPALFEKMYEVYTEQKQKKPRKTSVYLSPESVHNVKVPMNIRLGSTQLSIKDILHLEPGDVLQLNDRLTDSLPVKIGDAEFLGVLGKRRAQYAVKILERKSKYYDFQILETSTIKPVIMEQLVVSALENRSAVVEREENSQAPVYSEVQAAEIIPPETVTGQLTVEDIQIKDSLLEEFSTEVKDTATVTDEFTWDLDDLK